MIKGTFTSTIQASPEAVWKVLADLGTHASWSPKPYTVEWTKGEPNQVGSTYHSTGHIPGDKNHHNDGEITERVEPTRFALRAQDDGWFINEYDLRPVGDGATEVTFTLTFPTLKQPMSLIAAIAFPLAGKPDIRKRLAMLKEKVEAGS